MPNLNKRQTEFKKQMKQLQNVESFKEIMNDHDSFYHNTAYDKELEIKAAIRKRNNKLFIYFLIFFFICTIIYYNFDLIKSKYDSIEKYNQFSNKKISTKINYSEDEINQFIVGEYYKNYSNIVENQDVIFETLIFKNNFDTDKINNQITIIDDLILQFQNYTPEEINTYLHYYNLQILNSIKNNYILAINKSTLNIEELNSYNSLFRKKLIEIFNKINMEYYISENNTIHFTYKNID